MANQFFTTAMDFIDSVKTIDSLQTLQSSFSDTIKLLGFDHFSCTSLCDDRTAPDDAVLLFDYPMAWIERYHSEYYKQSDRVLQISGQQITPFRWDDPVVADNISKKQIQIFHEAEETGLIHGVTIPIYAEGFIPATVNVASQKPFISAEAIHAIHLMAIYLFDSATKIKNTKTADISKSNVSLTPREVDCLTWAGLGKTDSEISSIIHISANTVHQHIENAKRKYQVATRIQAVMRAYKHNQIMI